MKFTSADFKYDYTGQKEPDTAAASGRNGFAAFKDALFPIRVDAAGKVTIIDGYDDFKQRFDSIFTQFKKGVDPKTLFPKYFFQYLFERATANLPDSGASNGASWTKQFTTAEPNGQGITSIQSQMIGIKDDIVDIKTDITNDRTFTVHDKVNHIRVTGKGSIRLDAGSGLLLFSRSYTTSPKALLSGFNNTVQTTHTVEMTGKPI